MKQDSTSKKKRILIFSDTHLTKRFDEKKFKFLVKIIGEADRVIINGDFWDSWLITFEEFIKSDWKKLFPLLLEKNTVYIYGNHDPEEKNDKNIGLFSKIHTSIFKLQIDDNTYIIEHGRRILKTGDNYFLRIYDEVIKFADKYNIRLIHYTLNFIKVIGFKVFGDSLMLNSRFAKKRNYRLKQYNQNDWLICGDTHCPDLDMAEKFANTGCIMHGHANYIVIHDGDIKLVHEKYN